MAEALQRARQPRGKTGAGVRQWATTAKTQRALLDAALEVFIEQGFSNANISDVVRRAGSSVGSMYHHFGGKSELFIALWQEYVHAQKESATKAVTQAKRAGVTDPTALFSAGAKAYLKGAWQRRDLMMLFAAADTPPGFSEMTRQRGHQWISRNDALLNVEDTHSYQLYARILTSLIAEGAREVAAAKDRRQAIRTINAVLEYVQRLTADGPCWPQARISADSSGPSRPATPPPNAIWHRRGLSYFAPPCRSETHREVSRSELSRDQPRIVHVDDQNPVVDLAASRRS